MVEKKQSVYVFVGEDPISKDLKLKKIKKECLLEGAECFNLDVLYADELDLFSLQERMLSIAVNTGKRIIIIKDAQKIRDNVKAFILKYVKTPYPSLILVLDITKDDRKDGFLAQISRYAEVLRFKSISHSDTFALSRQIESRRTDAALHTLAQLLKNGEKPERIMGGLRYSWEQRITSPQEIKRGLKFLLNCDIDIKTGRLKADFALEKLIVNLCGFSQSLR